MLVNMSVIHFLISSEEARECLATKMPATPRTYTHHYTVKVEKMEAGEMAQRLRALATLPKVLS